MGIERHMKTLLLTATAILITLNIHAQGTASGTLSFTSVGATDDKRIWVGNLLTGQRAGAGYSVALYWGPAGTTDDRNLVQVGASTSLLGTTGGAATSPAGTYFGGGRTIVGQASPGPVLAFQVRAWTTAGGSTYEQAIASGFPGAAAKGPVFEMKTKNPNDATELNPNLWQAAGYRGFALIPEPSVIALSLLGAGALWMLSRRK